MKARRSQKFSKVHKKYWLGIYFCFSVKYSLYRIAKNCSTLKATSRPRLKAHTAGTDLVCTICTGKCWGL